MMYVNIDRRNNDNNERINDDIDDCGNDNILAWVKVRTVITVIRNGDTITIGILISHYDHTTVEKITHHSKHVVTDTALANNG